MRTSLVKIVSFAMISSSLLTGCGKSDATQDFNTLKLLPVSDKNLADRASVSQRISLEAVLADSTLKIPTFYESEPGEATFHIKSADENITKMDVVFKNNSELPGQKLEQSKTDPNTWTMRWTPPAGFVDKDSAEHDLAFTLQVRVLESTNPELIGFILDQPQKIAVKHADNLPKLVSVDQPQSINQGTDQLITIKATESSQAKAGSVPTVQIQVYKSADGQKFDWSANIAPDKKATDGTDKDGVTSFRFILHTSGLTLPVPLTPQNTPDTKATAVQLCYTVQVQSPSTKLNSETGDYCEMVNLGTQAPMISWTNQADTMTVKAGQAVSLGFTVKNPDSHGVVSMLSNNVNQFASGATNDASVAQDTSGVQSDDSKTYTFNWTPNCSVKGSRTLTLKFANTLGQISKDKTFAKTFTVSGQDASCSSAPAPAAGSTTTSTATSTGSQK